MSYVLDDAGVVVSRCDAADNPTAHATGALRSVLAMPLVPQPPPAATVPAPQGPNPEPDHNAKPGPNAQPNPNHDPALTVTPPVTAAAACRHGVS